jgi:hypothetical protein
MPIGNFTRVNLEAQACELSKAILAHLDELELLRDRCLAEFAAGTLDGNDFYAQDPTDKTNLLGSLDDWHAVYAGIKGGALPQLNYLRYINFLIGL